MFLKVKVIIIVVIFCEIMCHGKYIVYTDIYQFQGWAEERNTWFILHFRLLFKNKKKIIRT